MARVAFHRSHEQLPPSRPLRAVRQKPPLLALGIAPACLDRHLGWLGELVDRGFGEIDVHDVGHDLAAFIDAERRGPGLR